MLPTLGSRRSTHSLTKNAQTNWVRRRNLRRASTASHRARAHVLRALRQGLLIGAAPSRLAYRTHLSRSRDHPSCLPPARRHPMATARMDQLGTRRRAQSARRTQIPRAVSCAPSGEGTMKARGHASTLDLPDQRVAVCGDWHGNLGWARTIACVLPCLAPDVTTLLHLGDRLDRMSLPPMRSAVPLVVGTSSATLSVPFRRRLRSEGWARSTMYSRSPRR